MPDSHYCRRARGDNASPMGGKSGTTAAGSTALRMAHGPSTSQNDSQDSIGAAASQSQSQINLTAGATTTTHSTINCKHLPNRQTFLRVYYDAIRAIETGNVYMIMSIIFFTRFRLVFKAV